MIFRRVQDLICQLFRQQPEYVRPETRLVRDLGADSLEVVELVMQVEKEFCINIPDEDLIQLQTVQDLCQYIDSKMQTPNASTLL